METLQGFPYLRIEFTKEGTVFKPAQRQAILSELPAGTTDLLLLSHGWNNDIADAQSLYNGILKSIAAEMPASLKSRKFAVVGVLWPSKKFTEAELIPGGGASFGGAASETEKQLDEMADLLQRDTLPEHEAAATDPAVEKAKALMPDIEGDDPAAAAQLVEILRARIAGEAKPAGDDASSEDAANRFFDDSPEVILDNLAVPFESEGGGGIGGGAAGGVGSGLKSIFDRTKDVLNVTTYYVMKTRAGEVGKKGVAPLINDVQAMFPALRIHLAGHSFGGRVVTAAAANVKKPVASMALLQAAFSHNGLGDNGKGLVGFFRVVVTGKRVQGPIVITHSSRDSAVGKAYPIASRLAGDNAAAFGDANDAFGGMGTNGAQNAGAVKDFTLTPQVKLEALKFQKGKIYNLMSDTAITGHSDVDNRAVARMIVAAIATT